MEDLELIFGEYDDEVELPDQNDNIIRTKDPIIEINKKGLGHEIFTKMKLHGNNIAQIDPETGITETYQEVLQKSIRVSVNLKKIGVTPQTIITPFMFNDLNASVIFCSILFTGAKLAAINPPIPKEDQKHLFSVISPNVIIVAQNLLERFEEVTKDLDLKSKIFVIGKSDNYPSFDEFLSLPSPDEESSFSPFETVDLFDTVGMVFSSGSTGIPKPACLNHYSLLHLISKSNRLRYNEVQISNGIFATVGAFILNCLIPTSGQIKLICSSFSVEKTWNYLQKYNIKQLLIFPHLLIKFLSYERAKHIKLPNLKAIILVGGAVSSNVYENAMKIFPDIFIFNFYGATELHTFGLMARYTTKGLDLVKRKPISCGTPMKGLSYKVVDIDTGKSLGPNQIGELRIRTKYFINGYYKQNFNDSLDEDGFWKTGDIFYYDEDRCFFFVQRFKEMMRYCMCIIAPSQLEDVLLEHPSVKFAIVLSKDVEEGDLPFAVVVKKGVVTAEELQKMIEEKFDERKKLRGGVVFLKEEEIPCTSTGKVMRHILKEYVINNKLI